MSDSPPDAIGETDSSDELGAGTRMESVEEIRKALAKAQRSATINEAGAETDTVPFHPVHRAPIALLCVLDDGREDGEWIRIRSEKTVIGRAGAGADVVVPHDALMSGRHAELSRQAAKDGWRWRLTDLQSTNGTYVRAASALLKHGSEFLIGSRRFRFRGPLAGLPARPPGDEQKETRGWQGVAAVDLQPSVVEVTPRGEGTAVPLARTDNWIGRDPRQCVVALPDDRMVSPRHARLHRDARGRWHLDNAGSRNGTWVRVQRVYLGAFGQFQLGEQRFLIRILE